MTVGVEALPASFLEIERRITSGIVTSETELFVWDLMRRLERPMHFIAADARVAVRERCEADAERRL